ncbi:MAG: hypothetical protein VKJ46_10985 [Leptolyngbyaceae bacterium]|nr:hypothetical protein [Leptolyngbyaceae bacterium]
MKRKTPEDSIFTGILLGVLGIIALPAFVLIGFWWVNKTPETKELRSLVLRPNAALVQSFRLEPRNLTVGRQTVENLSLVETTNFTDRKVIQDLSNILAKAYAYNPGKTSSYKWATVLRLQIKTETGPRNIPVDIRNDTEHGAIIHLLSNGTSGWNLGTYRCPSLAEFLEKLAKRSRSRDQPVPDPLNKRVRSPQLSHSSPIPLPS